MKNYRKVAGKWCRYGSAKLDRVCEWQRVEQLWDDDPDFHYRKQAVASSFRWYVNNGKSRDEAYHLACQTQLLGLNPVPSLNVDARATWVFDLEGEQHD